MRVARARTPAFGEVGGGGCLREDVREVGDDDARAEQRGGDAHHAGPAAHLDHLSRAEAAANCQGKR
jgi:hypothetical protein